MELKARCGENKACIALANKNARTIWAVLAHNRDYQREYLAA